MSSGFERFSRSIEPDGLSVGDDSLREFLSAFRQEVRDNAQMPASFWTTQRASIRQRTASVKDGSLRWALGSVCAMVAMGVSMLVIGPAAPTTTVQKVDDDAVMRQVFEATNDTMPDALAPATLLANEVDRGLKTIVKGRGEIR